MTNDAIIQAGKLLDSPLAGVVASAFGADIGKARNALNKLTGTGNQSGGSQPGMVPQVDGLSKLRQGLKQLRGFSR